MGVWSSTLLSSIANISAAKHTKMCTRWDKLRLYIKTINTGQFKVGFSEKGCHLCRKKKKSNGKSHDNSSFPEFSSCGNTSHANLVEASMGHTVLPSMVVSSRKFYFFRTGQESDNMLQLLPEFPVFFMQDRCLERFFP